MKKIFAITAIAATAALLTGNVFAQEATDAAAAPDTGPITANVSVTNDYRYRGLTQSNFKPAIQGGFDYAHESGFYIGNWNSSISWVGDSNPGMSAPIEMDLYAGYKKEFTPGWTGDVGALQYYYPTSGALTGSNVNPNTTEVYGALSYQFVTLKYSYSATNLFGVDNSKGSQYIDLSANYDTGYEGVTVNGHVGYQKVANYSSLSYTDWKLGLTKDLGHGMSIAAAYIGTSLADGVSVTPQGNNVGRGTGVVSFTKAF